MSFQISDCTLRDGGYLTNKQFTPELINGVIDGLSQAGIDFIETGFLQTKNNGEPIVYHDSKDVRKYIPNDKGCSEFVGFCDNSRYSIDLLDECDHKSFESLRISFAKHERFEALEFCAATKAKGYNVFVQPMDAPGYTMEERAELIERINEFKPHAFAIVDTFGIMHLHTLREIFHQVDSLLDKDIKVGLHSHDNLRLSTALGEELLMMAEETDRSVAIDGSLFGMGRGAGNASTEAIANIMNKRYGCHYDIPILLDTIEKYIIPLKESVKWGYDMPMFLCGMEGSHVDNIYYMEEHTNCTLRNMYQVLEAIEPEKRKRYGKGYSKGDFSQLQAVIDNLKK
ncbi:MAG TPA: hypothetical protein PKW49_07335 [Paludibacteraceae bacterium]|nr:hypothetical protein [Paludibacteraceae bacterium]HQF49342.1 hypothetical protein [Paludibacteraceae bacterium]HQJ89097.1 hypothetical protein [Paludibacteraceae bacterium]